MACILDRAYRLALYGRPHGDVSGTTTLVTAKPKAEAKCISLFADPVLQAAVFDDVLLEN